MTTDAFDALKIGERVRRTADGRVYRVADKIRAPSVFSVTRPQLVFVLYEPHEGEFHNQVVLAAQDVERAS